MICEVCKYDLDVNWDYCPICGKRIPKERKNEAYYLSDNIKTDEKRDKKTAGLLGIFLGAFGIHRFYLGYTGIGIAQIVVSICTCTIGGAIWGFIEGLLILCDTRITEDADGNPLE